MKTKTKNPEIDKFEITIKPDNEWFVGAWSRAMQNYIRIGAGLAIGPEAAEAAAKLCADNYLKKEAERQDFKNNTRTFGYNGPDGPDGPEE